LIENPSLTSLTIFQHLSFLLCGH